MAPTSVRYDVVAVIGGRPQARQSFGSPEAAAKKIAEHHKRGHVVRCFPNSLTEQVQMTRLSKLAERVNKLLAADGFNGSDWKP
jgi:hypothetical protein